VIYNGKEHSIQELQEPLDHQSRFLKHMNIPADKVTVIIRADARGASGQVLNVIELCRSLQLTRFVLRTKQEKD
jgi:biopolymer transport protein ExbD